MFAVRRREDGLWWKRETFTNEQIRKRGSWLQPKGGGWHEDPEQATRYKSIGMARQAIFWTARRDLGMKQPGEMSKDDWKDMIDEQATAGYEVCELRTEVLNAHAGARGWDV